MLSADDRVRPHPPDATPAERGRGPRGVALGLLAAAVSGVLLLVGTGLHPVWWVTWLAPVPVLAAATRLPARRAAWTGVLAGLVGMAGYVRYLIVELESPVGTALGFAAVAAAVLTATVLLFRVLVRRGRSVLAAVAAPAAWAAGEYLVAVLTPAGSNWTLADSQADDLPVLALTAVGGPWVVAFLMLVVACALAGLTAPGVAPRRRLGVGALGLAALVVATVPGLIMLASPAPPAPVLPVSVVAAARPGGQPRADTPAGQALVDADLTWVDRAAPAGGLVVFPEKDMIVDDADLALLVPRFAAAATARGTTLVLGVEHRRADAVEDGVRNEALVFSPARDQPLVYRKRYLVPGVEEDYVAGDRPASVPDDPRLGVAICADLGQVSLGREYGRAGTAVLAVPALDFHVDAWSQSRVQFLRGVENGYAVARSSRDGLLTLSDARGRVLAQAPVDDGSTRAVTAALPTTPGGTFYSRWGDWFAWVCLAVAAAALVTVLRRDDHAHR